MEKEILEILKAMQQDIKGLKDEQQKANEKLDRIEKKIDITYDQVARSAEDITSIKKDLCFVEEATARNWNDIAKLKAVKQNDKKEKFRVDVHEISLFFILFTNTKLKRGIFYLFTPYKWLKTVEFFYFAKTIFSEVFDF